jgi:carboxymethylenebutenolidase
VEAATSSTRPVGAGGRRTLGGPTRTADRPGAAVPSLTVPGAASAPELAAHLAVPPVGSGPWPGVVVLHEAFGLTDDIRQQADRLARAGYLALAPDLFTAGGALRCLRSTFGALMSGEGRRVRRHRGEPRAPGRPRRLHRARSASSGSAWAGGVRAHDGARGFDASAPNYGPLPKRMDEVLQGACPVVASFGKRDLGLRGRGGEAGEGTDGRGVEHDVKEYPTPGTPSSTGTTPGRSRCWRRSSG